MTEAEWMAATHAQPLQEYRRKNTSNRKLRLFATACCRDIWDLIDSDQARSAVEIAEKFADGNATEEEIDDANRLAQTLADEIYEEVNSQAEQIAIRDNLPDGWVHGAWECAIDACSAMSACSEVSYPTGLDVIRVARSAVLARGFKIAPKLFTEDGGGDFRLREVAEHEQERLQATHFRDVFGNPFRPVAFSPDWRTTTATAIASQMYDSREFGAMPVLADALQDAGCENADILDHCRGPGPHVRGCWVVDLVLGKE